ncbi:putative NAD(P)H-dependent D-xylose reductase xyl1 [Plectosphaerella plurivora]|uniref:NAD(P)H-dependent D-xylose reductase xyl1 n=1 Tax=Plectosphaerella plurivora TaxID=936078 RepID=A0A9P9AED3_9PEZI|nr:putative NAD(P)H-dependent D-xylose reductase xyl1 [Plectosphaerella plurivora]
MATPQVELRSGGAGVPQVGFGLWKVPNDKTADVVYSAIVNGYRHFDSACDYGNEKETGEGIRRALDEGIVTREELFITTKLWATFHAKEHVRPAAERQLADLGLEYVDLYMIHFPVPLEYVDPSSRYPPGWSAYADKWESKPSNVSIAETYAAMEQLVDDGLVKSLGVCNFQGSLLLDLTRTARIQPAVLQIEYHPYLVQDTLVTLCKDLGIAVTGYSSFGPTSYRDMGSPKGFNTPLLLENGTVTALASKHQKTAAQVLLRWATQKGLVVIPKAATDSRQKENLDIFSFNLEDEEIKQIDSLDKGLRFNDPGEYLNPPQRIFA